MEQNVVIKHQERVAECAHAIFNFGQFCPERIENVTERVQIKALGHSVAAIRSFRGIFHPGMVAAICSAVEQLIDSARAIF